MEFIHSVLAHDETVAVGTVVSYDLPVNPLSHTLLTLKFAQNLADDKLSFTNVLALISRIEVLYKGSAVFSMSGLDAFACGLLVNGFESWGMNNDGNDDDERAITILVPHTRTLYSPTECYPRTTRGELILQITYAAAFTDIDTVFAQIETVEIPMAAPEQFIKMTTLARTPTATGQFDIELPIGNEISELVLWGETIPAATVDTATIDKMEILVDNINRFYSEANIETIHNMAGRMFAAPGYNGFHVHRLTAAAFAQWDDTSPVIPADHAISHHLHLPFDIFRDGRFALQTAGKSDVIVRIDAGDTGDVRVIPVEIVKSIGSV
ncbi:hypothetical protein ES707_15914 [subsurface metagenome]